MRHVAAFVGAAFAALASFVGSAVAQDRPPLRVQVLDAGDVPRPDTRVVAWLLRGEEAAARAEVVAAGADAIAELPWHVGERGTVELRALVAGAAPRRVVDLSRATPAILPLALPPVGALRVQFTRADGTALPDALLRTLAVRVEVPTPRFAGSIEFLEAAAAADGAVLQPVALGAACTLLARGIELVERREPGLDGRERTIRWALPADLVLVSGRLQPVPRGDGPQEFVLRVATEGRAGGAALRPMADGRFAAALPSTFAAGEALLEIHALAGGAVLHLPSRALQPGDNDLGIVALPAAAERELLRGRVLLDGAPAPPDLVLGFTTTGAAGVLPRPIRRLVIGDDGAFVLHGPATGVRRVVLQCPDRRCRLDPPFEYEPGAPPVVLHVHTLPVLGVDVLADDLALLDPRWVGVALQRQSDGREFGALLSPKHGATNVAQAGWHAVGGDDFALRVRLNATGEVLHEGEPFAIEGPGLATSRQLPPLDLRGRLRALHATIDAPPAAAGTSRWLGVRRSGTSEWRTCGFAAHLDLVVGGPVDLAVFGEDLWLERAAGVLGECRLIPQPAAAVRVELVPPPTALPAGVELRVRATPPDDEFAPFERGLAAAGTAIGADGSATVRCSRAGAWRLQLVALRRGTEPVDLGDPLVVTIETPAPRTVRVPAPDRARLAR